MAAHLTGPDISASLSCRPRQPLPSLVTAWDWTALRHSTLLDLNHPPTSIFPIRCSPLREVLPVMTLLHKYKHYLIQGLLSSLVECP